MTREFFQYADPWWFLALLPVAWILWCDVRAVFRPSADSPSVAHSRAASFVGMPRGLRARFGPALTLLRAAAFVYLVLALARPQLGAQFEKAETEGVDIVLALDVSGSMLAEDFRPRNRLQVAKDTARDFVSRRPHDRIGVVVFAGQSVPLCPPTLDHAMLDTVLAGIETGELEDGTAIGMGIASALARLRGSEARSRIIVLLTDGVNNRGHIEPRTAADLARAMGVKIHTVGVGSRGEVPYPFHHPIYGKRYQNVRIDLDEAVLRDIAEKTGGKFFLATDTQALEAVFRTIDEMEKTKVESTIYTRYRELFEPHLRTGAAMVALFLLLSLTVFRRVP